MAKLSFFEWLIVCSLIAILFLLAFITLFSRSDERPRVAGKVAVSNEVVEVSIKGEVAFPGIYELRKGAKMKDLLELGQPLPEADLSAIKPNAKLRDGQTVQIHPQKWFTVHVKGFVVEPVELRVKAGTLLKDIVDQIAFLPEADIGKLQKNRRLKDQEAIVVRKLPKKDLNDKDQKDTKDPKDNIGLNCP